MAREQTPRRFGGTAETSTGRESLWHRRSTWLVVIGSLGALTRLTFRPFVQTHDLQDFGLCGVLPNLLGTMCMAVLLSFHWRARSAAVGATLAAVVYEFDQRGHSLRTFDPWDIVASVIGGGLAFALLTKIERHRSSRATA
ncbi:MAG: hypothetical protein AAF628_25195 [Planctomycetota bacterium]